MFGISKMWCAVCILKLKSYLEIWLNFQILNTTQVVKIFNVFNSFYKIQRRRLNFTMFKYLQCFSILLWHLLTLGKSKTNCMFRIQCLMYCMTPYCENYIKTCLWYLFYIHQMGLGIWFKLLKTFDNLKITLLLLHIRISIYMLCLGVCLIVCLFVSNKHKNSWTKQDHIFCGTSRDPKEGFWMIKFSNSTIFDFWKFWKSTKTFYKILEIFCLFLFYMYSKRTSSQLK